MKTFILLLGLDVALSLSFEPCIPLLKSIFSHLSIPAPHTFLPLIHWLAQVGQGKRNSVEKEHKGRENCSQCLGRGAWTGRRAHHIYTIVNFALLLFFFFNNNYFLLMGQRNERGKWRRRKRTFLSQLSIPHPLFLATLQRTLCLLLISQHIKRILMLNWVCWINVMDLFNRIYIDSYSSYIKA